MAASSDPKLHFMQRLKEFGKEKVKKLKPSGYNCNQYIVACVASEEEVENISNTLIEDAKDGSLNMEEELLYFFSDSKRLAVIMNIPYWHGEARLLDPKREVWKRVADSEPREKEMVFSKRDFVGEMKENFGGLKVIGDPKIWLFSHFIPCTDPRHECARLIKEYVKASADNIILSYEQAHADTDVERACKILSGKHIKIIQPRKQQDEDIGEHGDEDTSRTARTKILEKRKQESTRTCETENPPHRRKTTRQRKRSYTY